MLPAAMLSLIAGLSGGDEGYLVVLRAEEKGYRQAAEKLARAHSAPVERWSGEWGELETLFLARWIGVTACLAAFQSVFLSVSWRIIVASVLAHLTGAADTSGVSR